MSNGLLLVIGIITVLIGFFLLFREEKTKISHYELEYIFSLINGFDSKVHSVLKTIEDKTHHCLQILEKAEIEIAQNRENSSNKSSRNNSVPLSKIKLKHLEVYNLFISGLSSKEIAIKLNKGVGEIETIISLFKLEGD